MTITARQLNRATLARQLLLRRESVGVVEAVHRVVALQAQEPASPYLALWNRLKRFDPAELDRAFTARTIVKGSLMRVTLHAVDAADYPAFHEAMQPILRAARLHDARFKVAGLSIAEADALVPEVQAYASEPRTSPEVEAWLDERLGVLPKPGLWWAYRHYAPFVHAATGSPWSFGPRNSYVAARRQPRPSDPEAALRDLVRRYLEGFGPATMQDVSRFAMVKMPRVRAAVAALGDAIEPVEAPDGIRLYDVPGGIVPGEDVPAPARLLGMWDNALLAYRDRSRIIPPDHRTAVIRVNGDVLPTLLVDGYVAGVWRPVDAGIEATAFEKLTDDAWAALDTEARALIAFLTEREPLVYGRYGHWWAKGLPSVDVRVLGG